MALKRGTYPAMLQDPFADAVAQPFWDAVLQERLVAPRYTYCGTFVLTPQPFCFNCQGRGFDWVKLPGTQGAGARMMLNITDCDPAAVRVGDKVEIWFDKISDTYAMPRAGLGPGEGTGR